MNRELVLILDDILIEQGEIAPFNPVVGRLGNVMLVNGEPDYMLEANVGKVVRLYLTNTANARTFNFRISGVRMKLVGSDLGRVEHEQFVEEVLLSSSERAIVDVLFERGGQFSLEHRASDQTYLLGTVMVNDQLAERSFVREFSTLRTSEELAAERVRSELDFDRPPDKTLALVLSQLVDRETGRKNQDIDWTFNVGDRVKIRILNEPHVDHPMPHPIHFHGQRFLVLSRDGARNENLAWKDTVLVRAGETLDVLLDMTNPGIWMAHCHIAEHLESGMMFTFHVQ